MSAALDALNPPIRRTRLARVRERYGPWAVVTDASSGIGRALAVELAASGLNLLLVARSAAPLEGLADELARAHCVAARAVPADLGSAEGLSAVESACANLDVGLLVAAAGFGTSGPLARADPVAESAMLDLKCRAPLMHGLHFGCRFAARGRGGIVLVASLVGFQGAPQAAHYAATKAYVQTLAEGLSPELGPAGVDVLVSAPGPVHTGFAERAGLAPGRRGAARDGGAGDARGARAPYHRAPRPAEQGARVLSAALGADGAPGSWAGSWRA